MHRVHRIIVGKCMWVMGERPDIAFTVKELARCVSGPTEQDWNRCKRLLRYLKGTMEAELWLGVGYIAPDPL